MKNVLVAKTVVFNEAGQVLLLRRSATDPRRPGQWDFPGGGIELGETFAQGAARELEEEAGISVSPTDLVLLYTGTDFYAPDKANVHRSLFMVQINQQVTGDVVLSYEHDASRWVSVAEALRDFDHPFYGAGLRYAVEHQLFD